MFDLGLWGFIETYVCLSLLLTMAQSTYDVSAHLDLKVIARQGKGGAIEEREEVEQVRVRRSTEAYSR